MNKILFFTGAGISAESGISTFRDNEDGLWTKYDPDVVATMSAFEPNKELVFKFYSERRVSLANIKPNKAHIEIAKLQKEMGADRVKIVTQNIDDLFEQAGCVDVVHVHGKMTEMRCLECNHIWDVGYTETTPNTMCPKCGREHTKPNVIFFGEHAPKYKALFDIFDTNKTRNDVVVVIGTSGNVVPMVYVTLNGYEHNSGFNILCNKDDDGEFDPRVFHRTFFCKATEAIDEIISIAKKRVNKFNSIPDEEL